MKYTLLIVCIVAVNFLFAQSLIVKGGVDISKRKLFNPSLEKPGKTPMHLNWIASENAAVLYEHHLNELFSITGGFGLTGRGYSHTVRITYVGPTEKKTEEMELLSRFHYLDLPLAFKVRTEMGPEFYFYGYAGTYFGVTVAAKSTSWSIQADTTGLYIHTSREKIDLRKWKERRWDFGYSLGFGVEIQNLFLEGVFSTGFTNIGPLGASDRSKNCVVMISAGYRFEWNKQSEEAEPLTE